MNATNTWNRVLTSGWLYWPACLVGVYLIGLAVLGPEAARRLGVERQGDAMRAEVGALAKTRDQLAAAERALQNDPVYTERIVRHELGITRPGEMRLPQPVKFQPKDAAANADTTKADPPTLSAAFAMQSLAHYDNPWFRFAALVVGTTLLGVGVLLSLPGKRPVQSQKVKSSE